MQTCGFVIAHIRDSLPTDRSAVTPFHASFLTLKLIPLAVCAKAVGPTILCTGASEGHEMLALKYLGQMNLSESPAKV